LGRIRYWQGFGIENVIDTNVLYYFIAFELYLAGLAAVICDANSFPIVEAVSVWQAKVFMWWVVAPDGRRAATARAR
jgi:hypothetical protein